MMRFGQTILLKPEGADAYVKYHADTWPGVLKMIKECNIESRPKTPFFKKLKNA